MQEVIHNYYNAIIKSFVVSPRGLVLCIREFLSVVSWVSQVGHSRFKDANMSDHNKVTLAKEQHTLHQMPGLLLEECL